MASTITFLQFINNVLNRVGEIQSGSTELTSFTDAARQFKVDLAKMAAQDVVDHVLGFGDFADEVKEGSITLVADQREYSLPVDFLRFAGDIFADQTNGLTLGPYPGGYQAMFADQPDPSDFKGTPRRWAMNPATNKIRVDFTPQSGDAGNIYKFNYAKDIVLSATTDTFPFPDKAVRALEPAAAELYRRASPSPKSFDQAIFANAISRALRIIRQTADTNRYG